MLRSTYSTHGGYVVYVNNYLCSYPAPASELQLDAISHMVRWFTPIKCDEDTLMKSLTWDHHQHMLAQMRLLTALGVTKIVPGMGYTVVAPLITPFYEKVLRLEQVSRGETQLTVEEYKELLQIFKTALSTSDCYTHEPPMPYRLSA